MTEMLNHVRLHLSLYENENLTTMTTGQLFHPASFIHSRCRAFSCSILPLQFVARTICQLPAPEHRSPVFPCPSGSDGSR